MPPSTYNFWIQSVLILIVYLLKRPPVNNLANLFPTHWIFLMNFLNCPFLLLGKWNFWFFLFVMLIPFLVKIYRKSKFSYFRNLNKIYKSRVTREHWKVKRFVHFFVSRLILGCCFPLLLILLSLFIMCIIFFEALTSLLVYYFILLLQCLRQIFLEIE